MTSWNFFSKSLRIICCLVPFIIIACQTQSDGLAPSTQEYVLEKEEVIPLDRSDAITSETSNFELAKNTGSGITESLFDKIRFRKTSLSKNLQNESIRLEALVIYPVEKQFESEAIKRANLQLNILLQKWFDTNYEKLTEHVPNKNKSEMTWNEIQVNFTGKNKFEVEISSPLDGLKPLSEEISVAE
ncbi:MAG: hypothetical protein ACK5WZ_02300 [Pseudobdellovibrionaceae bacterium]